MTVKAYIRDNSTSRFGLGQKAIVLFSIFSCLCIPTLLFTDRPGLAFLSYLTGSLALLAVYCFGGPTTVIGFLVTIFVMRFYFAPLVVKAAEGHAIWHNLYRPLETLLVLTCALLAMVVASLFFREKSLMRKQVYTLSELVHLRRLIIITAFLGAIMYLQALLVEHVGSSAEFSARFLGAAGPMFQGLLAFSLSLSVYNALIRGRSVFRSYSVILLFVINSSLAFTSVSRGIFLAVFVAIAIPYIFTGRRIKVSHICAIVVGVLLFLFVVSPTIIYFRTHAEFNTLGERFDATSSFWAETLDNPSSFRIYETTVSGEGYYLHYFTNYYGGLERFAILPDSDRLINGTILSNEYSGWQTITWAFAMVPPRFIYPEKPFLGPGAYLGQVAGLTSTVNDETQWVVGLPAEFYHAFSYSGVFFGMIAVLGLFFSVLKLFEYLGIFPAWQMFLALYYWSSFSEGHLAAILSTMIPLIVLIIALDRIVRYTRHWRIVIN